MFSGSDGVGDDTHSFAYDGHRVKKWNGAQIDYGEAWSTGDIIGTLIDFKSKEVMFWRNSKFLGVAFNGIPTGENCAYFPAISMEKGQRVTFNFGLSPISLRQNILCLSLNEPDCLINNYDSVASFLMSMLRDYTMQYRDPKHIRLSSDEKVMIGSLILEYLEPMLDDSYLLEIQFV